MGVFARGGLAIFPVAKNCQSTKFIIQQILTTKTLGSRPTGPTESSDFVQVIKDFTLNTSNKVLINQHYLGKHYFLEPEVGSLA